MRTHRRKSPRTFEKLEGLKRGDLVRVTYYDTYGYRSRTGILDEALLLSNSSSSKISPSTSTTSRTSSYADELQTRTRIQGKAYSVMT